MIVRKVTPDGMTNGGLGMTAAMRPLALPGGLIARPPADSPHHCRPDRVVRPARRPGAMARALTGATARA